MAIDKYPDAAIEWSLDTPLPDKVSTDERISLTVTITNEGHVDLTGGNKTTIEIIVRGNLVDSEVITIARGASRTLDFKFKIGSEGVQEIKLNVHYRNGIVDIRDSTGAKKSILKTITVETVEDEFNWLPVIIIVAALGAVGGIMYVLKLRKAKAEEQKRIAEEARRQEVIRKKEEEIAKKVQVRHVAGKHPRDYWILRRQKYTTHKPSGMTSGGLNILKKEKTKAEREAEKALSCPKCGTDLPEEGAECPRCSAGEKIEAMRHNVRSYKSKSNADFKDAEALLRKAEHRLNWSDYSMAQDFVDEAEARMVEIWDAVEKGERVESKVVEFSDAKGPTIDAKVIGLEGEDEAIPASGPSADISMPMEETVVTDPCPECGSERAEGECILCNFTEQIDKAWSIIEKGEMDGADMTESKDLTRQSANAHERGSDELAVRYLRRAMRLGDETFHAHARSKTEGIIRFTSALINQVKMLGEDVALAEQMIEKAETTMASGEYEAARSLAGKADGYLKQIKEDSYKKSIGELLPTVEAGAPSNPDVEKLLVKAKKLIDAKEFEGAVDLLEAAKFKL
jgi:hypothetical protein